MLQDKLSVEIGKTDADRITVDIGHQKPAGFRAEADQSRRPPADRSPDTAIVDQAESLKRRQTVGHDRAPEAGVTLDVEPGRCSASAHQREDRREALTLRVARAHPFGRRTRRHIERCCGTGSLSLSLAEFCLDAPVLHNSAFPLQATVTQTINIRLKNANQR